MTPLKVFAILIVATVWLLPAPSAAEQAGMKRAPKAKAQTGKTQINTMKAGKPQAKKPPTRRWTGYGFLPGYRQPPALTEWRDRSPKHNPALRRGEPRYWSYDGRVYYGWGGAGVYRGRWNGGSFGPCYTVTPIGMMWTCGR